MINKWVEWVEPCHDDGDVRFCRVSTMTAVKLMRESALSRGYEYTSDDDALNDFVSVHWAKITGGGGNE